MDKNAHFKLCDDSPFSNFDIALFYQKMVEENKLMKVFYDGSIITLQDFTKFVKDNTWFFFGFDRYSLVGGVWFTDFLENSCKIHICSFRGYDNKRFKKAINGLLKYILDNETFLCYKIKVSTPYKGIARMYQDYGFEYVGYSENRYLCEADNDSIHKNS